MSARPSVSVVVPFAGDIAQALVALALLRSLSTRPGDELILADNCGVVPVADDVTIVRSQGERSPAHARNAGAARATGEWILFLDADTRAPAGLIDAYFSQGAADHVGALAGEIVGAADATSLAARYGTARNFLSQRAHMAHPFRPRAAAANLLVRRSAFQAAGGFVEGVRAAEDTDFCWRLQDLGWSLELRPEAVVTHEYRTSIRDLRRQWRAYAAGRAWLAGRYPEFHPEPAIRRALRRRRGRAAISAGPSRAGAVPGMTEKTGRSSPAGSELTPPPAPRHELERLQFLALDGLLAIEELIGFRLPNRPGTDR